MTNGAGPYNRSEVNGAGYAGPVGSNGNDVFAEGAYLNGSYADEPLLDEPLFDEVRPGDALFDGSGVNGSPFHGPFDDEPPVGGIEATVWASLALGGARPSSTVAPDGSDDWTLPLPVVRPAPAPAPTRSSHGETPRGRRARREAEERAAEQWPADRWTPDRSSRDRHREPERSPGAHSADRPRHAGGHHEPEAPDDRPRASRRNAGSHARHSEESDDVRRRADRPRHRRPEH